MHTKALLQKYVNKYDEIQHQMETVLKLLINKILDYLILTVCSLHHISFYHWACDAHMKDSCSSHFYSRIVQYHDLVKSKRILYSNLSQSKNYFNHETLVKHSLWLYHLQITKWKAVLKTSIKFMYIFYLFKCHAYLIYFSNKFRTLCLKYAFPSE